jgi:hypothetical protein
MTIHQNSRKRALWKFTKRDVVRAVGAAQAAGIKVGRVDFDLETGKISVVSAVAVTNDTPLDEWLAKHGALPDACAP